MKTAIFMIAVMLVLSGISQSFAQLLAPTVHPKFVQKLPVIKDLGLRVDLTNGGNISVNMVETTQKLGLLDANGNQFKTKVWGYQFPGLPTTYPGGTIVAMKDKPVNIIWENKLPTTGHILPVDVSLHMAHPSDIPASQFYAMNYIPTVTHLHGGHTESGSDGLPEAWYTQNGMPSFYEGDYNVNGNDYHYDNDQEAATLWYHDHALGITRLNVYAGLAGFYLLRDENEMGLINDGILPSGDYEAEIVVQDRDFDATGQLFFPSQTGDPWFGDPVEPLVLPFAPSVVAEFFGNYVLVNGMAWPKYKVKQTKYRFRMLNGSDSRFYRFKIREDATGNFVPMMQIGTDNALLPTPVTIDELLLAPGERADIIVDFSNLKGLFTMINLGPDEPFKGLNLDGTNSDGAGGVVPPANPLSTGLIMQFEANPGKKKKVPTFSVGAGTPLREPIEDLTTTNPARKLALFEGLDADGRLQPLLGIINGDDEKGVGGVLNGSLAWFEEITENPNLGETEIWEVYNNTADAHPIHLHLVSFQILGRTPFTANVVAQDQIQHDTRTALGGGAYMEESSIVLGTEEPPAANEMGWKDTFIVPPGYMGSVIAKFDREGRYVWHCHILSHEDHEMMRPFEVVAPGARKGFEELVKAESYPNPFRTGTRVQFELKQAQRIDFNVYDMQGKMVYTHQKSYPEGKNAIFWDGFNNEGKILKTGVYLYRLEGKTFNESDRLVIQR